jgi:hypothetical protein
VKGIVLESFGVGNMPDLPKFGWLPWLRTIIKEVCTFRRAPVSSLLGSSSVLVLAGRMSWFQQKHAILLNFDIL